mmetsp:Transcript_29961/g.45819  ORF Transcript_29961/g.45819 Transcript_29961/m.45819 type:complete len:112 (-) Transcript_29961:115-450(-)
MLDDEEESYTSVDEKGKGFATLSDDLKTATFDNQTIFLKLSSPRVDRGSKASDSGITLYFLICVNTEEELSYIDDILFEAELKIKGDEYLDQREHSVQLKLNEASSSEAQS